MKEWVGEIRFHPDIVDVDVEVIVKLTIQG